MKKTLFALVLCAMFNPHFVFAQTASSTLTSAQVAELILQLQAQIKELQQQLVVIQQTASPEVTTSTEFVAVSAFTQTLARGMFSEEVKELQRLLAQNPEIYPEGVVSGYFGALTEEAVKRFQESHRLESVGVVGPKTRALLNETVSSDGGGSTVVQNTEVVTTTIAVAPPSPTPITPTPPQAVTPPPPPPAPNPSTGVYYGSYTSGGLNPSTPTFYSEPTPPAPPPATATSTSEASSTPPVSPTPALSPSPTPSPTPTPPPTTDTTGPTITSLSITPVSTIPGGQVSFTATAEDPSGIRTIIYDIQYPGTTYTLRPNCNFNGVLSGTCAFGESIDHGIKNPTLLGDYVIQVRIVDMLDNTATYYSNGTVTNGLSATHSFSIPAVTISAP